MKKRVKKMFSDIKKMFFNENYRVKLYYLVLRLFVKINDKTILYESYHGKSISCNPYAMYIYMIDNDNFKDYTHIWILSDISNLSKIKNTKYIKRNSFKNAYYLLASKYLINNTTFAPFFTKLENQIYINTWHGTPLKTLGKDSKLGFHASWNVSRNLLQSDYIISPNKYTTENFLSSSNVESLYAGEIIENGYPRNDFLFLCDDEKKN